MDKEFEQILPYALEAIGWNETKNGSSLKYKYIKRPFGGFFQKTGKWILGDKSAPSMGYTQIKYEDDIKNPQLKEAYNNLGITSASDLNNYETAFEATKARLKYLWDNELKKDQYDQFGNSIKSLEGLLYAWNRGTNKLNKGEAKINNSGYVKRGTKYLNQHNKNNYLKHGHYDFQTIVYPDRVEFEK